MENIELLNLTTEELKENVIKSEEFFENYYNYKGTNIKQANEFLRNFTSDSEKATLKLLLYSEKGWIRSICGDGRLKIKLVALMLGFTHEILAQKEEEYNSIQNLRKNICIEEMKVLISSYIKQKCITYKTLHNNGFESIDLFRGLKNINGCIYRSNNVESWSGKNNIAKTFATKTGIILKRRFNIKNVFACYKSFYKDDDDLKTNKLINIEYEYIIENNEDNKSYEIIEGTNLFDYYDV